MCAVRTFVPPQWIPGSRNFMLLSSFSFGLPSIYCDISGSINIKIFRLYICIHTLIACRTFLSVYYSDITNSESHSGPLHQLVTSNCAQIPFPPNTLFYLQWPSTMYLGALSVLMALAGDRKDKYFRKNNKFSLRMYCWRCRIHLQQQQYTLFILFCHNCCFVFFITFS